MKISLIIIFCLGYISAISQGIIAGDNSSSGIIYVDIVPDENISAPGPNSYENFNIDIDNDGTDDIRFSASWGQSMGMFEESTKCYAINEANISCYCQNNSWVDCKTWMSIIDSLSCWDNGGILKKYHSDPWSTYTEGIFNNGYIGFRINMNSQVCYGWIKASATSSSVTIYEYAYQGYITTVDDQHTLSDLLLKPNPVKDLLILDIPEYEPKTEKHFIILNILGKEVIEGKISSSNQPIDCSQLNAGYYFIYLTDGNTNYKPQKFLKF